MTKLKDMSAADVAKVKKIREKVELLEGQMEEVLRKGAKRHPALREIARKAGFAMKG
jgi:hypothetical protein